MSKWLLDRIDVVITSVAKSMGTLCAYLFIYFLVQVLTPYIFPWLPPFAFYITIHYYEH